MKYFELEYDNTCQKVLAVIAALIQDFMLPMIIVIILIWLNKNGFTLGIIGITVMIVCVIVGIISFIRTLSKLKGVFVFDDYIEIVSIDFFSRKIYFDDIYKLNYVRKYRKFIFLAGPGIKTSLLSQISAGGNKKCLEIVTDKFLVAHIKVKNQLELMRILYEKTGKRINVTDF